MKIYIIIINFSIMYLRRRFFEIWFVLVIIVSFFVCGYIVNKQWKLRTVEIPFSNWVSPVSVNIKSDAVIASEHKQVTKSLAELGPVPELCNHVLFFNRVPKSGSEMLVLLIQWLQGYNNFRHVRLRGGEKRKLRRIEQEKLVDEVTEIIKGVAVPLTFDRHVYFVNFTSFDKQSPTFINLIRDPVDKVVSRFYYGQSTPNNNNPDLVYAPKIDVSNKSSKSLEECVVAGDPECHFITGKPYDLTIPYFCGQDPKCMILNDHWALSKAKENVERYYPVVGILEELNTTLEVLEHTLPYFFKGIQKLYFKELLQPHHNKNRKKPKYIDEEVKKYLKESLLMEYDFYEWIQARLFRQLGQIYGHTH